MTWTRGVPKPQPNILWIVTTQWRAQALGSAGDRNARTPWLDALAREAINYTQAVTPHPFGPFARAALLTGVRSPANGVRDYFDPLPVDAPTVARALAARGYTTAFFGKWHLARRDPAAPLVGEVHAKTIVPPEARGGFDVWDGFESGFQLNDPWLHGRTSAEPERVPGYQSDVLCARAADWLAKTRGPWFAVVSLEAPHPPYLAPAAGIAARPPESMVLSTNVPRGGAIEARARQELAGYHAHIEATDRALGTALLSRLRMSETAVVFTSVHGDMHGAHGLFRKGWPHEESVRVPLLVKLPWRKGGMASTEPASLEQLREWALAWADGADAKALPADAVQRISMPSVVALPHQCDRVWRGVRTARRKAIFLADGTPWMFFDLERDPGEDINLAEEPAVRGEMLGLAQRSEE